MSEDDTDSTGFHPYTFFALPIAIILMQVLITVSLAFDGRTAFALLNGSLLAVGCLLAADAWRTYGNGDEKK